jgi:AraC-like DNA-binding protein
MRADRLASGIGEAASEGDVVIELHSGDLRGFIPHRKERQPTGCYTVQLWRDSLCGHGLYLPQLTGTTLPSIPDCADIRVAHLTSQTLRGVMTDQNRPAVDRLIAPAQVSREGQPLSYSRAPSHDLAPWSGRLYAIKVEAPADYRLRCGVFNDAAMVHVHLTGDWTLEAAQPPLEVGYQTFFSGPHTRLMPVEVTGSFISVGYFLRPGATTLLGGLRMVDCLDLVAPTAELGPAAVWSEDDFDCNAAPEEWFAVVENGMRRWLAENPRSAPNEITARFEIAAFIDPSISVVEFAAGCGLAERTLERLVRRDFGMSPKQVLRRARALDMASHLRGVADAAEAEALALRYYDQSHLIREFTALFGMSPRQFVARPLPVMTLALELRQCRRLAAIERLSPEAARPWA